MSDQPTAEEIARVKAKYDDLLGDGSPTSVPGQGVKAGGLGAAALGLNKPRNNAGTNAWGGNAQGFGNNQAAQNNAGANAWGGNAQGFGNNQAAQNNAGTNAWGGNTQGFGNNQAAQNNAGTNAWGGNAQGFGNKQGGAQNTGLNLAPSTGFGLNLTTPPQAQGFTNTGVATTPNTGLNLAPSTGFGLNLTTAPATAPAGNGLNLAPSTGFGITGLAPNTGLNLAPSTGFGLNLGTAAAATPGSTGLAPSTGLNLAPSTGFGLNLTPSTGFGINLGTAAALSTIATPSAPPATGTGVVAPKPGFGTPTTGILKTGTNLAGTTPGTSATVPLTQPTDVKGILHNKNLDIILDSWNVEIEDLVAQFRKSANFIREWDIQLTTNTSMLDQLCDQYRHVEARQKGLDVSLDLIQTQQLELDNLLNSLNSDLDYLAQNNQNLPADAERRAGYQMAIDLNTQLDSMERSLKATIAELNKTQKGPAEDGNPVRQIVQILNAHLNSLEWIDQNMHNLSQRLSEVENLFGIQPGNN